MTEKLQALHLHLGAGANIAMEGRSEDSFTPSYKWPNAADAKFQSPISFKAQIVFLRPVESCGHLLEGSADPLTSGAALCTKLGCFGPNCDPESLKTFELWAFYNLNCILDAVAFYLMSMKSRLMQI